MDLHAIKQIRIIIGVRQQCTNVAQNKTPLLLQVIENAALSMVVYIIIEYPISQPRVKFRSPSSNQLLE